MRRKALVACALLTGVACTIDNGTTEPGTPVSINWENCINDFNAPTWMAIKDGDGAWTRISPTNGVFTFTIRSGRVAMATYVGGLLTINYTTTDEANASRPNCIGARRSVTGTLTGYTSLDNVTLQADLGAATVSGSTPAPASFTLDDVTPLTFDVLAVRARSTTTAGVFTTTPSSVFIRKAQSASPLSLIDLNSTTEAGAPTSKTLTISNAASGEDLAVFSSLNTPTTAINLSTYGTTLGTVSGAVTVPIYGVPASRLGTSDAQTVDVLTSVQVSGSASTSRGAAVSFGDIADKAVTLGPAIGTVTVSGTARPKLTYTIQPEYNRIFQVDFTQGTGISSRAIEIVMTQGYVGSSATQVSLETPNLSGLSGFQSAWLLAPGATASYSFSAASATYSIYLKNNQSYLSAGRAGSFIP